jgi:2-methylcitrate dehydratase PrpD
VSMHDLAVAPTGNPIEDKDAVTLTETEALAHFVLRLDLSAVPADLVTKAKGHLLDALGTALAAATFDFAGPILEGVKNLGTGEDAHALATGSPLPLVNAALINGTLIHGLDYDDTHIAAIYHASAPALAACLAAGEKADAPGEQLLTAFIAALEIGSRIARGGEGRFHDKGFHPTAFAGGRLLGANAEQLVSASSLCGSQAAGLLEMGGSWLKRIHPGWAAHSGLAAVTLAKAGFKGATTALEGPHGFFMAHLGSLPAPQLMPSYELGKEWALEGIALKPYPCCHFIHAFADAALVLRKEIDIEQIERIECLLSERLMPLVGEPRDVKIRPRNSYDAMFSVPYVTALGLATGKVDLDSFHGLGVQNPAVLAVAEKTTCVVDAASDFPEHFPGEVRITLKDGRTVSRREATSTGTPDRPLSRQAITDKFLANVGRSLSVSKADRLCAAVWAIDDLGSTRELIQLCVADL